jgi:PAS domain S-box-containing protein
MKDKDGPKDRIINEFEILETRFKGAEELFEALFISSPIGIYILHDGKFQLTNPQFQKLTGYRENELLGTNSLELVLAEDRNRVKEKAVNMLKGKLYYPYEYRFTNKSGNIMWIMETVTSIQYQGRRAVLGNFMNITERKRAEEALRVSERFFSGALNDMLTLVAVLEPDGKVIFANNTSLKVSGIKLEDIKGKMFYDAHWWTYSKKAKQRIKESVEACASGKTSLFEIQAQMAYKGLVWTDYNMHPVYDEDGEVKYLVVEGRDITERKRAEEKEKQSTQRLLRIMQETIEAMALTIEKRDPYTAGHQHQTAKLAIAIAEEMGLSKKQIDGIFMAGSIHDLGKISIPAEILSKPSKLSEPEMNLIKGHPQAGYDILKNIEFPWPIAQILIQHHERMDGSGYPSGLSGENILLEARILAVADVVTAIAFHRPYRPALGIDKALKEISQNKDTLYDSRVVNSCLRLFVEKGFKFE